MREIERIAAGLTELASKVRRIMENEDGLSATGMAIAIAMIVTMKLETITAAARYLEEQKNDA